MTVLAGARLVTPDGVLAAGYLTVEDGRIGSVGTGPVRTGDTVDLGGCTVVPGFVDLHCHGGGGASYTTGDAGQARAAARFHLAHGTTSTLASLVTSPPELMRDATAAFAPLVRDGVLVGVHYEGPYLSEIRCGAQNPAFLRDPDRAELDALLSIGDGRVVRMVTIAPERAGALDAIRFLVGRGVLAAVGHTDARYEQVLAAVAAGATVGTHVFNGMRPPHHRDPGPVFGLLGTAGVTCEFIADGVHLHDGTLRFAATVTGPDRAVLVTDAMAAAGMADGDYELGGQDVTVSGGVARLARDGSIAGSTLTMAAAFRRTVGAGLSLVDASRMSAGTPARLLGLPDRGALASGLRADLVVLDEELAVHRVMRGGRWVER